MKLNTKRINNELKKIDRSVSWLAKEIGTSRQHVAYWIGSKSLAGVERIAKALGLNPKDLLK